MDGSCSTGVMARLANTLQGFDSTPEALKIRIDPVDEIRASLTARLNHAAQKNDVVMDKITSSDKKDRADFLDFVAAETKNIMPDLSHEYAHVDPVTFESGVTRTLESYTGSKLDGTALMERVRRP